MIDKNNVLVLQCIMSLIKCDLISAIKFAEHNQTCYNLAMAVAQAKDEDAKTEKEALIDKACEWLNTHDNYSTPTHVLVEQLRNTMKGE